MNRGHLGSRSPLTGLLIRSSGSDLESKKTGTAEKIRSQELRKFIRVPMIRWGEMCAGGKTQAGKAVELHSGGEIRWPFGPPLPPTQRGLRTFLTLHCRGGKELTSTTKMPLPPPLHPPEPFHEAYVAGVSTKPLYIAVILSCMKLDSGGISPVSPRNFSGCSLS